MKLTELSVNNITLAEGPEIGPSQELGFRDPSIINQLENTGYNVEGYDLYGKQFGDEVVFALKNKQQEVLTILVGTFYDDLPPGDDNRKTIQIKRSWTPPEKRRLGYAIALYDGLSRLAYRIVSDNLQSSEVFNLWMKLKKYRGKKVKLFNTTTKKYTKENPQNKRNILFVLEGSTHHQTKNGILEDWKFFTKTDRSDTNAW